LKKHVHLTWYRLVDGTQADPNDCAPGDDGVLRHKSGLAVATHADGTPQSVGREAADNAAVAPQAEAAAPDANAVREEPSVKAEDVQPEPAAKGYKTRESKTR
jgi:hypothetical protein